MEPVKKLDTPTSPAFAKVSDELDKRLRDNHIEVPMLPEVAGKVVRLTQDPDSGAQELAQLIQSDQTLAGHVMRVANSAAYSPTNSMVSLQQAITRLGMKLIAEIALAASINSTLFNTPGFEKYIQYQLKFSLSSGLWAKEVARICRKNVEAAFLAGLLHDIGRPVAIQGALEAAKSMGESLPKEDIHLIEEKYQRNIGVQVVQEWEMPQSVINVVKYYDDYSQPHKGKDQTMIVVAGALVTEHFIPEFFNETKRSFEGLMGAPVLADLNLYQDEAEQLLEKGEQVNSALEAMSP